MTQKLNSDDCCVMCGAPVPEGRQVCLDCEREILEQERRDKERQDELAEETHSCERVILWVAVVLCAVIGIAATAVYGWELYHLWLDPSSERMFHDNVYFGVMLWAMTIEVIALFSLTHPGHAHSRKRTRP